MADETWRAPRSRALCNEGEKRFLDETRVFHARLLTDLDRVTVDPRAPAWVQQRQREMQREYDELTSEADTDGARSAEPVEVREIRVFDGEEYRTQDGEWSGTITPKDRITQQHRFNSLYLRCIGMHLEDPTVVDADQRRRVGSGYLPEALVQYPYTVSLEDLNEIACVAAGWPCAICGPAGWMDGRPALV